MNFMWALETNFHFNKYQTCVARQNNSPLHALPLLSADAEGDTVSTFQTSLAGPESQRSSRRSGTTTVCPSCPTSCCSEPLGSSEPVYYRIRPRSSSLDLSNCLHILPEPLQAGNSPFMLQGKKQGACQPHLRETARSLMIMKCQGFLSQL